MRIRSIAIAVLVSAGLAAASAPSLAQLAQSGWPRFRADIRGTGRTATVGPSVGIAGWTFTTGAGISSSPAVAPDGTVYFVSQDQYLYAVNPDGTQKWRYNVHSGSYSSPTVGSDGTVYVGSDDYYVYAITSSGTLKWRTGIGKQVKASPAVAPDGTVYCGSTNGRFYAINSNGSIKWNYYVAFPILSSAAIGADGRIYFGAQDGYLYCLQPNGTRAWRYRASNRLDSSPAIDSAGVVYIASADGYLYAVQAGVLNWSYNIGAAVTSSPAIGSDGTIYIGSDNTYLYAITPQGTLKWRTATGDKIQASPAVGGDDTIYCPSFDGKLYAFQPDGSILWQSSLGGSGYSSAAIAQDGTLYAGCSDGKLYSFVRDSTPPTTPVVVDDGSYSTSATSLHATWSASDPETGISEYQYAIGTTSGGTDVLGWTSTGTAASVTRSGLALTNGARYYFSVKAKNGAGVWSDIGVSDGITVDFTPPSTPVVTDDGQYTNLSTSLHASWTSADAESGITLYEYAIGTSPGAVNVVGWTSTGQTASVTRAGLNLQDGVTYYFSVRATNAAGLVSSVGTSDGIKLDRTPPSTPVVTDDGSYSTSSSSLHATWSSSDPESGIAFYEYAIGSGQGQTDVKGWTQTNATSVTATGLSLTDGTTYYFSVRATSGAGQLSQVGFSDGVIVDSSPPTTPLITDDGQFTSSPNTLRAWWSSSDPHSAVVGYEYGIGTGGANPDLVGWTSVGSATTVTRNGLPLIDGQTYYFYVRATNGAGLVSQVGKSDGITVDRTPPGAPVVTDDGAFTSSANSLHAVWSASDPVSGIADYQYAIGTSPGGTEVTGWASTGGAAEVTRTGLSLQDGVTYYISVRARNGADLWSSVGVSDGIRLDLTPPSTPVVTDDGQYTSQRNQLHGSWIATDVQSAIAEYQYAIGTTPGATNVLGWTSAGTALQATATGLQLQDGVVYYIAVKARNGAGLWSAVGVSDGITVDGSAPSAPVVTDDGAFSSATDSLHATWSASDPESGVIEYQYAIGTTLGAANVVNWTSVGGTTSVTRSGLSLAEGVTYYFSVRARNGAGLLGPVGSSDGITIDRSPPTTPVVTDDGVYTSSTDTLHATWSASDPQSGIAEYQYAIGASPGSSNVVNWTSTGTNSFVEATGLNLQNGVTYYFSVRALNQAGHWSSSGFSDGITVDSSGPGRPVVTDDGDYTQSGTTLHATWTADPGVSGITEYQYAIGTTSGATNIVNWTSTGTTAGVTRSGLSLQDGVTYYFAVRARNAVGVMSPIGVSDGITVDRTPPTQPTVTDDGAYSSSATSLHASWAASDPQSGIAKYEYAIGTAPGLTNVVNWTSAGTDTQVTRSGLNLTEGGVYYFSVRATNGAGLVSAVGVSDGIIIDSSPPSTPTVIDDGEFTTVNASLHASWSAADAQSGIAEYQYAIGTTSGATDVVNWTSAGTALQVTRAGLSLQDGQTYYFAVKARNNASQWSAVGTSNGITVDASAPSRPAVTDDGEYTSSTNTLHAVWSSSEPHTAIVEYQYAIGTSPGGTSVVNWTSTGITPSVTRNGLSLSEGVVYYFAVRARNSVNLWSQVGTSDGIAVDTTPPSTPVVTDDGDVTASGDFLQASWSASDPQGGIAEFQYAIGTSPGGTDVVPFTSAGAATQISRSGLSLNPGQTYYFAVKARNKAGLWSAVGVSDGITYVSSVTWSKFRGDSKNRGISNLSGSRVGALMWEYNVNGWLDSSPAIAGDGTIYYGSGDGKLYAISRNGTLKWTYQTNGPVDSSPAIGANGTVFFGSYDGYLYSLASNGQLRWRFNAGDAIWSSPLITPDQTVYFGCQDWSFYALNPDGTQKWKYTTGGSLWSSPALSDTGSIYFGSGDGAIYALDAATGTLQWKYQTGSAVDASPAIGPDGAIFAGSGDGYFYALNPNGTLKWRYYMGWPPDCSPSVTPDGTVYVGFGNDWSYGLFMALNPNGTVKWQFDANGMVRSSPVVSQDGYIYFGSGDGHVYALDTGGNLKWQYQTGYAVLSSPVISNDGSVVVASYNGTVFNFKDSNIADSTPPITPTVLDTGAATTSLTTLSASWSSSDPESGVVEYRYAIGTWPGTDDVIPWTSVGTQTSVTRSDLDLTPGVVYYFSATARNGARIWSATGFSDGILVVQSAAQQNIGQAKLNSDGVVVNLAGKIVTAVYADCFYVEEPSRGAAIKVVPTGQVMPSEGSEVSIAGALINSGGERAIRLSTLQITNSAQQIAPVVMRNKDLGGGPPASGQPGVTGGNGLNSIGLLCKTTGRITAIDAGYWVMDDGSGVSDPAGGSGIKVSFSGLASGQVITPPAIGQMVTVTGVISMEPASGGYRSVLRPRRQSDIE